MGGWGWMYGVEGGGSQLCIAWFLPYSIAYFYSDKDTRASTHFLSFTIPLLPSLSLVLLLLSPSTFFFSLFFFSFVSLHSFIFSPLQSAQGLVSERSRPSKSVYSPSAHFKSAGLWSHLSFLPASLPS